MTMNKMIGQIEKIQPACGCSSNSPCSIAGAIFKVKSPGWRKRITMHLEYALQISDTLELKRHPLIRTRRKYDMHVLQHGEYKGRSLRSVK